MRTILAGMVLFACVRANGPESRQNSTSETSPPPPAPGAYKLDPGHSFVYFAAQHMVVGRVRGHFNEMSGTFVAGSDPQSSRVDVRIDAGSVDTQNDLRDAELRGPDFFDAAAFPTIEYHATGFRRVGEKWIVDGTLTIREISRAVPLELVYKGTAAARPGEPSLIAFYATAAVKRADFGMTRGLLDEIGVVFQGEHFIKRYGPTAAENAPPISRMLEMGVPVGAGTDATRVASYNPFVSLYWLVTGKTVGGTTLYPESDRLDRMEALRLWTVGSFWFSGEAEQKGRIAPGQLADLAVLSRDYFSIPDDEIRSLESSLTIVGAEVVHASREFSELAPPALPESAGVGADRALVARVARKGCTCGPF